MRLAGASPMWPQLLKLAHTLAYDAACLGEGPPPATRLSTIEQPVLVATGAGVDPHMAGLPGGFFGQAADAITGCLPYAEHRTLDVREHTVNAKVLAPVLTEFFRA